MISQKLGKGSHNLTTAAVKDMGSPGPLRVAGYTLVMEVSGSSQEFSEYYAFEEVFNKVDMYWSQLDVQNILNSIICNNDWKNDYDWKGTNHQF